jgi:small subunit ribosomal protein S17
MTEPEQETSTSADLGESGRAAAPTRGHKRRERTGTVVSDKMMKTVVVRVERVYRHPHYEKVVRRSRTFYAHDEAGTAHVGDLVRIRETRPLSKRKRWEVVEVVKAAQEPPSGSTAEA